MKQLLTRMKLDEAGHPAVVVCYQQLLDEFSSCVIGENTFSFSSPVI